MSSKQHIDQFTDSVDEKDEEEQTPENQDQSGRRYIFNQQLALDYAN